MGDGTDHRSHEEQNSMIRRYIIWRNRNAHDKTMAQPMSTISLNGQCLGQGAPLIDDVLNIDWAGWIEQHRAVVAAIESQAGSSCLGPPGDYDDLTPMALGCELAYVPCFTLSGPR